MASSMTGYGSASMTEPYRCSVELRSVNNRFLKVSARAPEALSALLPEIEALLRDKLSRGTVSCFVSFDQDLTGGNYRIETELARKYYKEISDLNKELGGSGEVSLEAVLALPGVFSSAGPVLDDGLKDAILDLTGRALESLIEMRASEGKTISQFVAGHARVCEDLVVRIEKDAPKVVIAYKDRLVDRVNLLLKGSNASVGETELAREIAVFAERSDISEEIERTRSHLQELAGTLDSNGAIGRKLDFITQELFREANTMASKAGSAGLTKDILELKCEVDRIREQVQNLE